MFFAFLPELTLLPLWWWCQAARPPPVATSFWSLRQEEDSLIAPRRSSSQFQINQEAPAAAPNPTTSRHSTTRCPTGPRVTGAEVLVSVHSSGHLPLLLLSGKLGVKTWRVDRSRVRAVKAVPTHRSRLWERTEPMESCSKPLPKGYRGQRATPRPHDSKGNPNRWSSLLLVLPFRALETCGWVGRKTTKFGCLIDVHWSTPLRPLQC